MDRVLLTLGNTQLQAVLDRNRGLFVLFQAEVTSAGGSWLPYDASPPGSPSPGRTSGDNHLPAGSSSASSDHGDWRPRLRSPSLEPRSRSPPRPEQRLPPPPPAARPRSQRRVPEPAGNARRPQPPCPTAPAPVRRRRRKGNRAGLRERDRRVARAANTAPPSCPFGAPPGPSPFSNCCQPSPSSGRAPALAARAPERSGSSHLPRVSSSPFFLQPVPAGVPPTLVAHTAPHLPQERAPLKRIAGASDPRCLSPSFSPLARVRRRPGTAAPFCCLSRFCANR